jgi:hypothetical protein
MKKLFLISAIAMSGLMYQTANAQIGVRFHINLGLRPVYAAPAPVYADAGYYYLPDVEAYYSVNEHCYYYQDGANWVSAAYLPGSYHNYDWQHARRFAVNEPQPYLHNNVYRARYGGVDHRDWGYSNNNVYASRERVSHDQQYRGYNGANGSANQRNDDRGHFDGRTQEQHVQQNNDRSGRNEDRSSHDGGRDNRY